MGGLQKLKLALESDCTVSAQISRDSGGDSEGGESLLRRGSTGFTFEPAGFEFSRNPPNYNFNAFVAASSP
jgi:glucan endo-1,3-alpha-glucosidase